MRNQLTSRVEVFGRLEAVRRIPVKDLSKIGVRFFLVLPRDEGEHRTQKFSLTGWGDVARSVLSMRDGDSLRVTGHLRRATWTDRDSGVRQYDTEIVAESVEVTNR